MTLGSSTLSLSSATGALGARTGFALSRVSGSAVAGRPSAAAGPVPERVRVLTPTGGNATDSWLTPPSSCVSVSQSVDVGVPFVVSRSPPSAPSSVLMSGVWRQLVSRNVSKYAFASVEQAQALPGSARQQRATRAAVESARAVRAIVMTRISTREPGDCNFSRVLSLRS